MACEYLFYKFQTVIVGSGAAGLNAAAALYKEGCTDIAILTEGMKMGTSRNTGSDKQTYYKLTACGEEPDSVRRMAETLFDGGCVDGDLALTEAALSSRCFFHLVDIGVPFPYNDAGEYVGYKTDHDPCRRGTSAGPLTSKYMTEALQREVERYKIPVFDGYQVIELLTEDTEAGRRVRGVLAVTEEEHPGNCDFVTFSADNVIYAVGGEAGLYETSVYPPGQTGGMGTALRIGAKGKNLTESQYGIASIQFRWNLSGTYQQVIPRYFSTKPDGSDEREFLDEYFADTKKLLAAIFLKGYQWPFDPGKTGDGGSSLIDLLVYQEIVLNGRRVFLDYRRNPAASENDGKLDFSLLCEEAFSYLNQSGGIRETPIARLEAMNPAAIALYQSNKIDLYQEPLEIAVCAQHGNGGLAGNAWWESNIRHLFPVGEVNGSHGVARPGGSALNAGQVGSLRAAQYIARTYQEPQLSQEKLFEICGQQIIDSISFGNQALNTQKSQFLDLHQEQKDLRKRTSRYGSLHRSKDGIQIAIKENDLQRKKIETGFIKSKKELKQLYRLRDLLISQHIHLEAIHDYITHGGKSRGSYFITDKNGTKPSDKLPDDFCFLLAGGELSDYIQEAELHENSYHFQWRKVHPIPDADCWFERVWKAYQETC